MLLCCISKFLEKVASSCSNSVLMEMFAGIHITDIYCTFSIVNSDKFDFSRNISKEKPNNGIGRSRDFLKELRSVNNEWMNSTIKTNWSLLYMLLSRLEKDYLWSRKRQSEMLEEKGSAKTGIKLQICIVLCSTSKSDQFYSTIGARIWVRARATHLLRGESRAETCGSVVQSAPTRTAARRESRAAAWVPGTRLPNRQRRTRCANGRTPRTTIAGPIRSLSHDCSPNVRSHRYAGLERKL